MACPELHSLEIAVNKFIRIRCIWFLPFVIHTALTQRIASVESVYNMVYYRCRNILKAAKRCPSLLLHLVSVGLGLYLSVSLVRHIFVHWYIKIYSSSDIAIACLITEVITVLFLALITAKLSLL